MAPSAIYFAELNEKLIIMVLKWKYLPYSSKDNDYSEIKAKSINSKQKQQWSLFYKAKGIIDSVFRIIKCYAKIYKTESDTCQTWMNA